MTGKQLPYIARTALPAFALMMAAVGLLYAFPAIITWLPQRMVG
jgi:TRAP-type C4-dicarboxylate transport system permease large subunit